MGDWVDQRIKVESWQVRVLSLDEHYVRGVVPVTKEESAYAPVLWPSPFSLLCSKCLTRSGGHGVEGCYTGKEKQSCTRYE